MQQGVERAGGLNPEWQMFADADLLHDAEIAAKLGFIALQGNYDLTSWLLQRQGVDRDGVVAKNDRPRKCTIIRPSGRGRLEASPPLLAGRTQGLRPHASQGNPSVG